MICRADTGEVLQSLEGHRDYGFACDWADDGWTVASGNQDMQVKIWDARKWTNSSGIAQPIATIAADMAGVRKLKFSPLGSGKRVLIAAEPADIVSVIDGERFMGKQTLSFFGEIGGVDFTNDGQDLVVANCDPMRGGLMEFERCDLASGGVYNLEEYQESRIRRNHRGHRGHRGYDWMDGDDDDLIVHPKARGTVEQRRRKPAGLGINMGYF
jgi:WD40 repeat protein